MPVNVRVTGIGHESGHRRLEQAMHQKSGAMAGAVVYVERLLDFDPEFHPFLNDTFGAAMNQNVTFSGVPEKIHNGGSSVEWDATAISGTWNFADSGKITLTSGADTDAALFEEEGASTVDWASFTALTGKVDLDTYSGITHDFSIQFDLAGVAVGDSLLLNSYIDTGDFAEQTFVIPKADFNFATTVVDGLTLALVRAGGPKPTVKFDDIQMEAAGDPLIFKATTPKGTKFHITELRIAIADNITGITSVADASENATVPNLAYDDFMGITSPLTNGVLFSRVKGGKTIFNVSIKQLGDFLATGANIANHISDGTNTFITMVIEFPEPIILNGTNDDFLSYTINDNLSGLLQFTAAARGALEV
jgi:hypothetical protein